MREAKLCNLADYHKAQKPSTLARGSLLLPPSLQISLNGWRDGAGERKREENEERVPVVPCGFEPL